MTNTEESEEKQDADITIPEVAVVTPQKASKSNPYKTTPIKQEFSAGALDVSPVKGSFRHRLKQKAATSANDFVWLV